MGLFKLQTAFPFQSNPICGSTQHREPISIRPTVINVVQRDRILFLISRPTDRRFTGSLVERFSIGVVPNCQELGGRIPPAIMANMVRANPLVGRHRA